MMHPLLDAAEVQRVTIRFAYDQSEHYGGVGRLRQIATRLPCGRPHCTEQYVESA
jgi:hypothetical protein